MVSVMIMQYTPLFGSKWSCWHTNKDLLERGRARERMFDQILCANYSKTLSGMDGNSAYVPDWDISHVVISFLSLMKK